MRIDRFLLLRIGLEVVGSVGALADLLPSLLRKTVYVGLSAGSMVMTRFGTTYGGHTLPAESDKSLGLVDQTAIKVTNGTAEVISEGQWKLFAS